ncbi:hypothetical protein NKH10_17730 [Mesorhizobium sp. M1340]|uniref:hypothetical protein n=1 Tax=unclassified Mesorhizobium TaxID=325217 RepID=UPI00333AD0B3
MTVNDIVGAVAMARWLLDAKDPKATFYAMLPAVTDQTSCEISDSELFELAMAIAGFGAIVRGDFTGLPSFGETSP